MFTRQYRCAYNSTQTYRFDPVDGKTGSPPRKDGRRGQILAIPLQCAPYTSTVLGLTLVQKERVQSDAHGASECTFARLQRHTMQKLVNAYKANPTWANARRIMIHNNRHSFASILLSLDDQAVIGQAIIHHYKGE